ncbi:MAG: hypothetical protein BMS9Abin29_0451 [Gemmatimonadota bacterium]|nr:MAG: hypothetical protein BMS9Abin29_0451 [Gemmatimonadota bacterium]
MTRRSFGGELQVASSKNDEGTKKKSSANSGSSMTSFYWILGIVAVIAVGSVGYSLVGGGFTEAALAAIPIEYENPQELVELAAGVERGDPDAPITILEFADFQCPACLQFATRVKPEVDLAYVDNGVAKFVFQDFPLAQHPHAFLAARAARCALDQGGQQFWAYHDQLYANQSSWSPSTVPPIAAFQSYAQGLGLNQEEFNGCLNSDRHSVTVSAGIELGQLMRVNGTPTIFVSGGGGMATRVSRWGDFSAFQEIVESLLAEKDGAGDAGAQN